jgi:hypothetical protein
VVTTAVEAQQLTRHSEQIVHCEFKTEMVFQSQETAVQNQKDSALVELGALASTFALAPLIFGITALSAFSLFVIAGLAALCFLIAALVAPGALACGSVLRPRKSAGVRSIGWRRNQSPGRSPILMPLR